MIRYACDDDPDLGDEFSAVAFTSDDRPTDGAWETRTSTEVHYKHKFVSDEHMIFSDVFQQHLNKVLAHKDQQIADLRKELDTLCQRMQKR